MSSYVVYEKHTGKVVSSLIEVNGTTFTVDDYVRFNDLSMDDYGGEAIEENLVTGECHLNKYFSAIDGRLIDRPLMQPTISATEVLADGAEESIVANLPIPATVNVNGQAAEVDDGELVLTFDTPGEYRLIVEAFPYKSWEVTIHAT